MKKDLENIRNIAIIAHVDHGKTTLVDKMLHCAGSIQGEHSERILDSDQLEKERGITIFAKNTMIEWKGCHINIVDTPGHADFGGEVERILSMVDSVLLLVDAAEGPMPQTRFVTQKAFEKKLNPILVINKIDKDDIRTDWVIEKVFDLFCELGASDKQLDFPIIYTSATKNIATYDLNDQTTDISLLLDMIIDNVPAPNVDPKGPFQMQISALDYSSYVGAIGIGKVYRGNIKNNAPVKVIGCDNSERMGKILKIFGQNGLQRKEIPMAMAGDIVAISGIEDLRISDTICDPNLVESLPVLSIDEPTVSMMFMVNDSPFAGKEGKFVTSRKIKDRLDKELIHNVALRVESTESADKFKVSGRGELHISILIENMRREGFEFAISRPEVIKKTVDHEIHEPFESLIISVPQEYQGVIMELLNSRQGKLQNIIVENTERVKLEYIIPTRGLIGFHIEFMNATSGTGIMHHVFDHYGPETTQQVVSRKQGVLIANTNGTTTTFAIWNLQPRGKLIVSPQTEVYEGMVVGLHSKDNDLVVNIVKEKQLTNIRAAGKDEKIILIPPLIMSLEQALETINDDELVEVTPKSIRIRKKFLKEHERKRASRQ
jgi:GTP-binding protein